MRYIPARRQWIESTSRGLVGGTGLLLALTAGAAAQTPPAVPYTPNDVITSTMPANGDQNPYGVAFVPGDFSAGGKIAPSDIVVSNFNNKGNLQGTGTTIIVYAPSPDKAIASPGTATVFFQSTDSAVVGLDTGLAVLRKGFVLVCFLPSADGTFATHKPGGILVLDKSGAVVGSSITKGINSPWDMTVLDRGTTGLAFVSNVGNANDHGFVTRFMLSISKAGVTFDNPTIVASGYKARPNKAGFVTGPTGLVYDPASDILYVAATRDNAVFAVPHAGTRKTTAGPGTMVFRDLTVLRGPLGMAQAPNGDLVVANSDLFNGDLSHPSEYVEFTKNKTAQGAFVSQFNVDVNQGGAFGIANAFTDNGASRLAVVDDNAADLNISTGLPPATNGANR